MEWYTIQHRTVVISFPLILQAIIIAQIFIGLRGKSSSGGFGKAQRGGVRHKKNVNCRHRLPRVPDMQKPQGGLGFAWSMIRGTYNTPQKPNLVEMVHCSKNTPTIMLLAF